MPGEIELRPLTPRLGAEVAGLDLAAPLAEHEVEALRWALADRGVLVFRDQHLDREAHKTFGRLFGSLHRHPLPDPRSGDPEIVVVETTARSAFAQGEGWHSDVTCEVNPPVASALHLTESPAVGGDTVFADMRLAYDRLSPPMRRFLDGLHAVHDGHSYGSYGAAARSGDPPRAVHPVVIAHPVTGRKVLYVNPTFTTKIVGLRAWESDAILGSLYDLVATNPALHCRVRWEPGTLTLWDNRSTQHHAVWDYHPHTRYGERVTILGDNPPRGVIET